MLRIATTPAIWMNEDDTKLDAGVKPEALISEIADLGYEGVEDGRGLPQDPAALKDALSNGKLDLVASYHGTNLLNLSVEEEREAMEAVVDRMKTVGCKTLILREVSNAIFAKDVPMSKQPNLSAEEWDSFGLKLEQLATWLADQGITAVYQPYAGTVVQTPEEVDKLMMETGPNLFLLFDTAQAYVGGGEPTQVLTRHLPRVRHVHLGDVRVRPLTKARMSDQSWKEAVRNGIFTLPGDKDGSVDFRTVMNLLTASNYEGWLTVSAGVDPERTNISEVQRLAYRTVAGLAGRSQQAA